MSSTLVLDAASISSRSTKRPASISMQAEHLPQGCARDPGLAVQALRQDARERRLADAARAGEQVGVVQPLLLERVPQRAHDVLLPDQLPKSRGRHLRAST